MMRLARRPTARRSTRLGCGILFAATVLGPSAQPWAQGWSGTLRDGTQLRVDPDTRRAVRDQGGAERPMWDGVHYLQDGSMVIIRDGTAVPTRDMLETWDAGPAPRTAQATPECDRLVQRVCGPQDACGQAGPCLAARKLLQEAAAAASGSAADGASGAPAGGSEPACAKALSDPAFPVCTQVARGAQASDCARLVERVCGADGRCAKSPGCDPARQLLGLESEERAAGGDPRALTATGEQCREALTNPFFKGCQ
jgi:hypothetical protein